MTNTNDTSTVNDNNSDLEKSKWQLNALTEALGDLCLTVNDSLSVGRGSDNDVVLGSKQVSRNHALLSVLNDELYVKDLESSNGTFVNDNRIENNKTKLLNSDDTVTFASFAFKVSKVRMPLTASDNKHTIAEDTTVAVATDTLAGSIASVDTDLVDTDLTDIGAIDTGVMTNEVAKTEVVDSDLVDNEVSNIDFVDSNTVESSVMSGTINDNDITDAEIIDIESVDINSTENTDSEPVDTKLAEEPTPLVDAIDVEDAKLAATLDDTSDIIAVANPNTSSPVEPIVAEETILNQPILAQGIVDNNIQDVIVEPINTVEPIEVERAVVTDSVNDSIVKQTIINDVLSSTESANHESSTAPVHTESLTHDTELLTSEPLVEAFEEKPELVHQPELLVTPEHDKTTITALQEEADPDVLRAKQAATSQFSGTANLGQSRDVGTEGNNALDQAISNPATHNNIQKKPSGSWFIWVFIAIIIIGLALWLFNKGAV